MTDKMARPARPDFEDCARRGRRRVAGEDPVKRAQILDGAREVFSSRGFDAASMSEIASAAQVSKGTLYVYFADKEHLFVALIEREREQQKQALYDALRGERELRQGLRAFGERLASLLLGDFAVSAQRVVMGVAERMPELGGEFYARGPLQGARRLADYLRCRVADGELAIEDCDLAASQFIDLCLSTMIRPRMFNMERSPPSDERISRVVASAVEMFMARYGGSKAAA